MIDHPPRRQIMGAGFAALLVAALPASSFAAAPLQGEVETAGGRALSIWTWPAQGRKRGTILFSHGAASAPRHYTLVLQHWAESGYHVVAPLHVDSTEHPRTADFIGLASWSARIEDMRALSASLGNQLYMAAGHSYGALTAIALGGGVSRIPDDINGPLQDPMAVGVIALSPPPAIAALVGASGYASVATPLFVQTGTRDLLPGATQADDWMGHLAPYEAAMPDGHHYALVLPDVDHYFGGLIGRPDADGPPSPQPLDHMLQLSSLFLAATAQRSKSARRKLKGHIGTLSSVRLHHK